MIKLKKLLVGAAMLALPLTTVLHLPTVHAAPGLGDNLEMVASGTGLGDTDLRQTIGSLINVMLSVLGIIFLLLIIWAGFKWMTAQGEAKETEKARDILISATVGLIILLSAYAISNFVIEQLTSATGYDG